MTYIRATDLHLMAFLSLGSKLIVKSLLLNTIWFHSNYLLVGTPEPHFENQWYILDANCVSIFFNVGTNIEPQDHP